MFDMLIPLKRQEAFVGLRDGLRASLTQMNHADFSHTDCYHKRNSSNVRTLSLFLSCVRNLSTAHYPNPLSLSAPTQGVIIPAKMGTVRRPLSELLVVKC